MDSARNLPRPKGRVDGSELGSDAYKPDPAPAERDAEAILARVQADEEAADRARDAFDRQPLTSLAPDAQAERFLGQGERVIAVRRSVAVERRVTPTTPEHAYGLGGDLYVTSRRIVLMGRVVLSINLDDVAETLLAGEQCLLVTRDGHGVAFQVPDPRLLRVEIAAARAEMSPGARAAPDT